MKSNHINKEFLYYGKTYIATEDHPHRISGNLKGYLGYVCVNVGVYNNAVLWFEDDEFVKGEMYFPEYDLTASDILKNDMTVSEEERDARMNNVTTKCILLALTDPAGEEKRKVIGSLICGELMRTIREMDIHNAGKIAASFIEAALNYDAEAMLSVFINGKDYIDLLDAAGMF